MWGDQAGSLKTAANRITICRAADYTMITMRVECAIGVEPTKSTLCRREPWPLGYAHEGLPGMDSNHHVACFRGRWATDYPTRQGESASSFDNAEWPISMLRYGPPVRVISGVGR